MKTASESPWGGLFKRIHFPGDDSTESISKQYEITNGSFQWFLI